MTRRTPAPEARIAAPATDPELLQLLERAARMPPPTPEQIAASRRSWVIAETAIGSDADEAAYREAFDAGDTARMARLDAEGQARGERAAQIMREMGL